MCFSSCATKFNQQQLYTALNVIIDDYTLQQLKQQRDKLKQYQKKISVQLDRDRDVAKQLLKDGKKE